MPSNTKTIRKERDNYTTPYLVITGLLTLIPLSKFDTVIDLGCGDGRIGKAIIDSYKATKGEFVDLYAEPIKIQPQYGNFYKKDAVSFINNRPINKDSVLIAMNPPFSEMFPILQESVKYIRENRYGGVIAMLMPLSFFGSEKKTGRATWFSSNKPKIIGIINPRPSFTNNGKTDSSVYAWVFWDNISNRNTMTSITWINCV